MELDATRAGRSLSSLPSLFFRVGKSSISTFNSRTGQSPAISTMSALVTYESSSDEYDVTKAAPKPALTAKAPQTLTNVATGKSLSEHGDVDTLQNVVSEAAAIGPLLGPVAPTNADMIDADSPAETSEDMSERDTIRHLTQASVPMTSMPPSPPGSPDPAANARFARFLELKVKGVHFNEDLASKTSFLNPGLLATMMARTGIDEEDQYNTSLPLDLWNPRGFPEWAYKEGLLESQQKIRDRDDAEKKALSAAGRRTIDFAASGGNSGDSSRKSTPSYQKKRRRP